MQRRGVKGIALDFTHRIEKSDALLMLFPSENGLFSAILINAQHMLYTLTTLSDENCYDDREETMPAWSKHGT